MQFKLNLRFSPKNKTRSYVSNVQYQKIGMSVKDFNVNIYSSKSDWLLNPSLYCIVTLYFLYVNNPLIFSIYVP